MQSTLQLFHLLYNHVPPLVPERIVSAMEKEVARLEQNPNTTLSEIERSMIVFGYQMWPWNQAYAHFLRLAEHSLGDHFLIPKMSEGLQLKYASFKEFGGTLGDVYSGRPASFFSIEEREELGRALVEMRVELKEYVRRELMGMGKQGYLQKVGEYEALLEKIKMSMESLRDFLKQEEAGSPLAVEIETKIQDFEHGLCLLGRELDYDAVCQAQEFFAGRKAELNRMRGINIPMQIDFYNSAENLF